jgi:hypothetical protein
MIASTGQLSCTPVQAARGVTVFDYDEAFHALEHLDEQGRQALKLAGRLWEAIYRDEQRQNPTPLMGRYLAELSERTEEVRELHERLDDVLDSREKAELRAERAEALLEKERWQHYLHHREPRSPQRERPDERDAELLLLRRQLSAAEEAEFVAIGAVEAMRARMAKAIDGERRAFRIAEHQRDRALGAEQQCDELRDEIGRLRAHLDF